MKDQLRRKYGHGAVSKNNKKRLKVLWQLARDFCYSPFYYLLGYLCPLSRPGTGMTTLLILVWPKPPRQPKRILTLAIQWDTIEEKLIQRAPYYQSDAGPGCGPRWLAAGRSSRSQLARASSNVRNNHAQVLFCLGISFGFVIFVSIKTMYIL